MWQATNLCPVKFKNALSKLNMTTYSYNPRTWKRQKVEEFCHGYLVVFRPVWATFWNYGFSFRFFLITCAPMYVACRFVHVSADIYQSRHFGSHWSWSNVQLWAAWCSWEPNFSHLQHQWPILATESSLQPHVLLSHFFWTYSFLFISFTRM